MSPLGLALGLRRCGAHSRGRNHSGGRSRESRDGRGTDRDRSPAVPARMCAYSHKAPRASCRRAPESVLVRLDQRLAPLVGDWTSAGRPEPNVATKYREPVPAAPDHRPVHLHLRAWTRLRPDHRSDRLLRPQRGEEQLQQLRQLIRVTPPRWGAALALTGRFDPLCRRRNRRYSVDRRGAASA